MEKPYFIMMYSQSGKSAMPMVDDFEDVLFFETEQEARTCANEHDFCKALGFEVFDMDDAL
jgi:hypothetical protein